MNFIPYSIIPFSLCSLYFLKTAFTLIPILTSLGSISVSWLNILTPSSSSIKAMIYGLYRVNSLGGDLITVYEKTLPVLASGTSTRFFDPHFRQTDLGG